MKGLFHVLAVILAGVAATASVTANGWQTSEATWYGPGFEGNTMACGGTYRRDTVAVAHRTLPCGTLVEFRHRGRTLVVPVRDRGPYGVPGRDWDLTRAACQALDHCFTGPIEWRLLERSASSFKPQRAAPAPTSAPRPTLTLPATDVEDER